MVAQSIYTIARRTFATSFFQGTKQRILGVGKVNVRRDGTQSKDAAFVQEFTVDPELQVLESSFSVGGKTPFTCDDLYLVRDGGLVGSRESLTMTDDIPTTSVKFTGTPYQWTQAMVEEKHSDGTNTSLTYTFNSTNGSIKMKEEKSGQVVREMEGNFTLVEPAAYRAAKVSIEDD